MRSNAKPRSSYPDDFDEESSQEDRSSRKRGLKLRLQTRIPRSIAGRIFTAIALLLIVGTGVALLMVTRNFLIHDDRFVIQTPASIEIQGNKHLTRSELLDIFGDDVQRNIFNVSLNDRQAALEQLPWVKQATIMRLLPNRIRVSIAERTPVAFARQSGEIKLVDSEGILLDMAPAGAPSQADAHFSFPVVTGVSSADPLSTRAARMRIYQRFIADLDSSGEKISATLSEVDLTNPEDVKAVVTENSSGVLVHFGEDHFLERYHRFKQYLPAWRKQFPNLASVDLRYESKVVLDMANAAPKATDSATPAVADAAPSMQNATPAKPEAAATHIAPAKPPIKAKSPQPAKPAPHKTHVLVRKASAKHPAAHLDRRRKPAPKPHAAAKPHVTAKPAPKSSAAKAPVRSHASAKPSAGKAMLPSDSHHPQQVAPR